MNYQAGRRLGVNVYLIDGGSEFLLIDIGYSDTVEEIVELIRQMDFNLSRCRMVIATHADADHIQGLARAKELLKTKAAAHPLSIEPIESADEIITYATIKAQDFAIPLPPVAEQKRIVAELERRLSVAEQVDLVLSANTQRATGLRQSVLQQVFSVELATGNNSR